MIKITNLILNEIIEYSKNSLPAEACGYLAGSGDVLSVCYKIRNVDDSPEHFTMDVSQQFNAYKDARKNGFEIKAVFHSHPSTPARPSEEDKRLAYDQNIFQIIVSLAEDNPVVKCFKIENGDAREIIMEVI